MGSFLIVGMGRFGKAVATELYAMKHDVMVIDDKEERLAPIANNVTEAIIGDAKDEAVFRSLDIFSFDCVVVSIASAIEDSVLTTIMLKEMGAKMLVCKAQNDWHAKILTGLGADRVIQPEADMGKRVAHFLSKKSIVDYLELSPEYGIMELLTPSRWFDKSISQSDLRKKHGITIIAIRDGETGGIVFSPNADAVMRKGDVLTMLGTKRDLDVVSGIA